MSNDDKMVMFTVSVVSILILFGIGLFYLLSEAQHRQDVMVARQRAACESIGGVLLDRTYALPKAQVGHNYTCVRKDTVLEIK